MKTLIYIFLSLVSCFANNALAEIYGSKTFGGTSLDEGHSVQQTTDGGYIIVGFTDSFGEGFFDVWLIKVGPIGGMIWDKTFGEYDDDDGGFSVQQTTDGGYIITGVTCPNSGVCDVWLIKTDTAGNMQWDKTFGGTGGEIGNSIQQTADEGYIIVGATNSYGAGWSDVWLIKTDPTGVKQWDKTFGGTFDDNGRYVLQTVDGGYIITGYTYSYGAGYSDVWLIKTDAFGIKQWDKTFGGTDYDYGYSGQQTTDGGYIITGVKEYYGICDLWLIKTDASGNKQWDRTFGGNSDDEGYSVQQTADGGFIITGYTSYAGFYHDVWLVKTDASGNKQWDKIFGGTNHDRGYSVQQTTDLGYIITGETRSYGAGSTDVWLIYYNPEGYETSISDLNLLSVFLIILSLSSLFFLKRKRA